MFIRSNFYHIFTNRKSFQHLVLKGFLFLISLLKIVTFPFNQNHHNFSLQKIKNLSEYIPKGFFKIEILKQTHE